MHRNNCEVRISELVNERKENERAIGPVAIAGNTPEAEQEVTERTEYKSG